MEVNRNLIWLCDIDSKKLYYIIYQSTQCFLLGGETKKIFFQLK